MCISYTYRRRKDALWNSNEIQQRSFSIKKKRVLSNNPPVGFAFLKALKAQNCKTNMSIFCQEAVYPCQYYDLHMETLERTLVVVGTLKVHCCHSGKTWLQPKFEADFLIHICLREKKGKELESNFPVSGFHSGISNFVALRAPFNKAADPKHILVLFRPLFQLRWCHTHFANAQNIYQTLVLSSFLCMHVLVYWKNIHMIFKQSLPRPLFCLRIRALLLGTLLSFESCHFLLLIK